MRSISAIFMKRSSLQTIKHIPIIIAVQSISEFVHHVCGMGDVFQLSI
jgi:hypothetical protein